jgi:hypothetical protein
LRTANVGEITVNSKLTNHFKFFNCLIVIVFLAGRIKSDRVLNNREHNEIMNPIVKFRELVFQTIGSG